MCLVGGLPLPSFLVSDTDLTDTPNPLPGGGTIHCVPLTVASGFSALRHAASLGKYALELLG